MPDPKPSLTLLRELTDTHVLEALIAAPRLTRAELAERTGISKPTVGDSVRRLVAAGLVADTGARTSGRGAVGSYFALADDVGVALALDVAPEGIVGELVDVRAEVLARATAQVRIPARPGPVSTSLRAVAQGLQAKAPGPIRLAVVSAADPVQRRTGRLVQLPYAPFLVGALTPADALLDVVTGPVVVDNDVNWAARAERRAGEDDLDDFVYLYLGAGLGCAVVGDGEVLRGHDGFAGEIGDVVTCGPDGHACPFIEVFARLGLRQPGSTAIDVAALLARAEAPDPSTVSAIAQAVAGVLAAAVAFADPAVVVLGGPWGTQPSVVRAISDQAAALPRRVAVRPAQVDHAPLAGARLHAVDAIRAAVVSTRSVGALSL
jgi:predicted NBD/HSP70 family sugar kinase